MTKRTDAGMTNLNHLTGLLHPAADRDKILLGFERVVRIKRHARRKRVLMQQDRVTVGLRTRCFGGSNHAASAADVFYHDRLSERFLHRILEDTGGRVVGAARRNATSIITG